LLVAGLLALGCGGTDGDAGQADGTPVPADTAVSATDSTPADTTPDPFTGFRLESEPGASAELRRLALSLRNDGPVPAIVRASGGADEVLLDTVPPGATRRVDLLTRAPSVTLRSLAADGRTLRTGDFALGPDSIIEVRVDRESP
jgi:hypothetical protein